MEDIKSNTTAELRKIPKEACNDGIDGASEFARKDPTLKVIR
jgi:hypothetical protein